MKHNIEEINTAIRLGDKVLPPINSVVEYHLGYHRESHEPNQLFRGKVFSYPSFLDGIIVKHQNYWPLYIRTFNIKVISLPDDAPPFEDWVRPKG